MHPCTEGPEYLVSSISSKMHDQTDMAEDLPENSLDQTPGAADVSQYRGTTSVALCPGPLVRDHG